MLAGGFLLFLGAALVGLYILVFFVFGTIIPPNAIGVRQNFYGIPGVLEKGIQTRGLNSGLHWKVPGISTIFLIPRGFQFIHFNDRRQNGDLDLPVLDIPTLDGSKVKTDITLVVRYFEKPKTLAGGAEGTKEKAEVQQREQISVPFSKPEEISHGGPRELVLWGTKAQQRQLSTMAQIAEDELRASLRRLSTTDYYNPVLRETAALNAKKSMNSLISKRGAEVWGALIRRYTYAEQNIDDQIFAKTLQEQTELLNAAESRLAAVKAKTEQERALWDAKIESLKVEAQAKVGVIRSEGEKYEKTKFAEGDLLVDKADAQVKSAKAKVFYEVQGADVYIAREMAPLLETLNGGIVTGIDPFDINAWVKKFTGKRDPGVNRGK